MEKERPVCFYERGNSWAYIYADGHVDYFVAWTGTKNGMRWFKDVDEAMMMHERDGWTKNKCDTFKDTDNLLEQIKADGLKKCYVKNIVVPGGKHVRMEVDGAWSDDQRAFVDVMGRVLAHTIANVDPEYVRYVVKQMRKLVESLDTNHKESIPQPVVNIHVPEVGLAEIDAAANTIHMPINKLIKGLSEAMLKSVADQQALGLSSGLIATTVEGALAFFMANAFCVVSETLGTKMSVETYKTHLEQMFKITLADALEQRRKQKG